MYRLRGRASAKAWGLLCLLFLRHHTLSADPARRQLLHDHLIQSVNSAARRVPIWPFYLAGAGWAAWLFYLAATGGLGVEPIEALEHRYGKLALQFFIAVLAITPLRRFLGLNFLRFRRMLGLMTFFFVLAHLLVWALLDVQSVARVWADIVKRPYITVGMSAFVLLLPLAVTSNNLSLRRLGAAAWRRLHRLTYPAAVLGAVHYIWLAKGFQLEPILYTTAILVLLALRIRFPVRRVAA
jgi:sulfoxide reductase heme-binding subunit YedZ